MLSLQVVPPRFQGRLVESSPPSPLPEEVELANPWCWTWLDVTPNDHGYVQVGFMGRKVTAHRLIWELVRGPIPTNHTLDHLCRNRACSNPDHLEPTTDAENILRGNGQGARNARKTHCIHGHLYTPENTIIITGSNGRPARQCRVCRQAAIDRYRQEHPPSPPRPPRLGPPTPNRKIMRQIRARTLGLPATPPDHISADDVFTIRSIAAVHPDERGLRSLLAEAYGVTPTAITFMLKPPTAENATWKSVPHPAPGEIPPPSQQTGN